MTIHPTKSRKPKASNNTKIKPKPLSMAQLRYKAWQSINPKIKHLLTCYKHSDYRGKEKPKLINKVVGCCPSCWLIYTQINNMLGIKSVYDEEKTD